MHIRILDSGAGGGFPQWNCNYKNCQALPKGNFQSPACTQSSITVSSDNENWVVNALHQRLIGDKSDQS